MSIRPTRQSQQSSILAVRTSRVSLSSVAVGLAVLLMSSTAYAAEGLNLAPDPIKLAINLLTLLIIIYPVKRWLLEPLARILQEREARTTGAEDRSGDLVLQADQLANQIEARLRDARIEAQRERTEVLSIAEANERAILSEARSTSAHKLAEVREALEHEMESARRELRAQGTALADLAASQLLGRPV